MDGYDQIVVKKMASVSVYTLHGSGGPDRHVSYDSQLPVGKSGKMWKAQQGMT